MYDSYKAYIMHELKKHLYLQITDLLQAFSYVENGEVLLPFPRVVLCRSQYLKQRCGCVSNVTISMTLVKKSAENVKCRGNKKKNPKVI